MVLARLRKPTSDLSRLHNEVDDLFDSFFRGLDRPVFGYRAWPPVEISERDDAVLVKAEVPGCKADEIDISVAGSTLTISGEKKRSTEQKDKGYYHAETVYGSFRRDIEMPAEIDPGKVEAECKNGVLSITLPKAEVTKAIKVKVNG